MSAQITGGRRITDDPRPVPAVGAPHVELAQLARQGQDASLRSLQVWADLARKLGHAVPRSPTGATICACARDPFEKLLEAQRQVVDELVATQRQLVKQLLDGTATAGGGPDPR